MISINDLSEQLKDQSRSHHNVLEKIQRRLDTYDDEARRIAYSVEHLNDKISIRDENKRTRQRIHDLSKMTIARNIIGLILAIICIVLFLIIGQIQSLNEKLNEKIVISSIEDINGYTASN